MAKVTNELKSAKARAVMPTAPARCVMYSEEFPLGKTFDVDDLVLIDIGDGWVDSPDLVGGADPAEVQKERALAEKLEAFQNGKTGSWLKDDFVSLAIMLGAPDDVGSETVANIRAMIEQAVEERNKPSEPSLMG